MQETEFRDGFISLQCLNTVGSVGSGEIHSERQRLATPNPSHLPSTLAKARHAEIDGDQPLGVQPSAYQDRERITVASPTVPTLRF